MSGLRKFKYPPSWLVIFPVVLFNRVHLFSKNLIAFIIPFDSLFVRLISEPLLGVNVLLSLFISLLT